MGWGAAEKGATGTGEQRLQSLERRGDKTGQDRPPEPATRTRRQVLEYSGLG